MPPKTVRTVHKSSQMHWVGNGFPVRSLFDYNGLGRDLNPFLLLDYAAPYEFAPGHERRGVAAHPHKGFETVTIAYQGELEHRDSSGGGGTIGPGDVQWMTAGGGIVHEEFHSDAFTRTGGILQMIQLWVNLPAKDKNARPAYQTILNAQIPVVDLPRGAGDVRVIAGDYTGHRGVANTFTPINLWDVTLLAANETELPLPTEHVSALFVIAGDVAINEDHSVHAGGLAIFEKTGDGVAIQAKSNAQLLIMDGLPINEPVVGQGPFVMNTREELQKAYDDYQAGQFGALT